MASVTKEQNAWVFEAFGVNPSAYEEIKAAAAQTAFEKLAKACGTTPEKLKTIALAVEYLLKDFRGTFAKATRFYELCSDFFIKEPGPCTGCLQEMADAIGGVRQFEKDLAVESEISVLFAETGIVPALAALYVLLSLTTVTFTLVEALTDLILCIQKYADTRKGLDATNPNEKAWEQVKKIADQMSSATDALNKICTNLHKFDKIAKIMRKMF